MVVHEQRRRQLHGWLANALGTEAADVLMEELPPVAWTDLATKVDLGNLALTMRAETAAQTRTLVFGMLGMWIATIGALGAILATTAH